QQYRRCNDGGKARTPSTSCRLRHREPRLVAAERLVGSRALFRATKIVRCDRSARRMLYLAPLAGRGRPPQRRAATRRRSGEGGSPRTAFLENPPHPGPLPASGAREQTERAERKHTDSNAIRVTPPGAPAGRW